MSGRRPPRAARTARTAATLAPLVAALVLAGCTSPADRPDFDAASVSRPASTSAATVTSTAGPATAEPSGTAAVPPGGPSEFDVDGPLPEGTPAARAGEQLALGPEGFSAEVTFAGVVLGRSNAGIDEVFVEASVRSDGTDALLALTMTFAICPGTVPVPRPDGDRCVRTRTEYGELGVPALVARVDGTRTVVATGDVDTYEYPGGGAREGTPTWTRHRYPIRITVSPRFEVDGGDGSTYVAVGTVQVGPYTAREDGQADNVLVLPVGP